RVHAAPEVFRQLDFGRYRPVGVGQIIVMEMNCVVMLRILGPRIHTAVPLWSSHRSGWHVDEIELRPVGRHRWDNLAIHVPAEIPAENVLGIRPNDGDRQFPIKDVLGKSLFASRDETRRTEQHDASPIYRGTPTANLLNAELS